MKDYRLDQELFLVFTRYADCAPVVEIGTIIKLEKVSGKIVTTVRLTSGYSVALPDNNYLVFEKSPDAVRKTLEMNLERLVKRAEHQAQQHIKALGEKNKAETELREFEQRLAGVV